MAVESLEISLKRKEDALERMLSGYGSVVVAYSGGVDSSYLAAVAHRVLGERAVMVLADSPSIPRVEVADAIKQAQARDWNLIVLKTREFEKEDFLRNDGTRCYHCKTELFTQMNRFAGDRGIKYLAYGEIADDKLDPTRYGAQAAREHHVVAPLAEADLYKDDIRSLSRALGLPTWDKAPFACLSSRFPTGTRVNTQEMTKVEKAEEILRSLGFYQYRARHHGELCRIEVETADFPKLMDPTTRERIVAGLREAGYRHVTLDLAGYRMGSTAGATDKSD